MEEIATISKGLLLQHSVIKHRVSQQLLQLAVLVLQGLQELAIRYLEAAVLGLPFEERGAADPLLAADVGRLGSGLLLAQDPDDLLFREPARLHVHRFPGDGLYPSLRILQNKPSTSRIFFRIGVGKRYSASKRRLELLTRG
jgi:hypothetical protein